MKPRIDVGGRQGRDPEFIQGNSSASKPGAHMPITFEGDEPPDCWQWISDMKNAAVDLAKLAIAVAIVFGIAGLAYTFFTN